MAQQGYGFGKYGRSNWGDTQYELATSNVSVSSSVVAVGTQIDLGATSINVSATISSAGSFVQSGASSVSVSLD